MKLYTKDGKVSSLNNIILIKDGMQVINPTEEMVLADGWTEYVPEPYVPQPKLEPYEYEVTAALKTMVQPQLASLSDEEALKVKSLYPSWASKTGEVVDTGEKLYYDDRLYKVRQEHTVQEQYPPSVDTASLYEEINEKNAGTLEDPIPYNNNMELENGKYYSQNGVTYLCTRDTGTPVYADLKDLVDIYVKEA